MSNAIFPSLPGLAWGIAKSPKWATMVSESASGRQYTLSKRLYPLWHFKLPFEFLRAGAPGDLQTLVGFINARRGRYDDFLYLDPRDNAVSAQGFGSGDGTTTAFQLVRSLGGFSEPIYDPVAGSVSIFRNAGDWRGAEPQYVGPRTNLVVQSQSFVTGSGWGQNQCVATSGYTAPDGSTTAHKITTNLFTGRISISRSINVTSGVKYAQTWYAKAGEWSYAAVFFDSAGWSEAAFPGSGAVVNLSTGAVTGSQASLITVTQAPNGFWRIAVAATANASASTQVEICPCNNSSPNVNGIVGDGTSGIYVWGCQAEASATPTPYIPTTTAAVTKTDITSITSGLVTFAAAPVAAAALTWSGSFYFRCRFLQDEIAFEQFLQDLWSAKSVEFQTFRP